MRQCYGAREDYWEESKMAGYLLVLDHEIKDEALFAEFLKSVGDNMESFGGKYLVKGGRHMVMDGQWAPVRIALVEFESADGARRWLDSQEYAALGEMRRWAAEATVIVLEGVEG